MLDKLFFVMLFLVIFAFIFGVGYYVALTISINRNLVAENWKYQQDIQDYEILLEEITKQLKEYREK